MTRKQLSQNKLGKVQRSAAAEPCITRAAAQMCEIKGEPLSGRSPRWPGFPCNWKQSHLQQWELYLSRTIAAKAVPGRPWDRYEYVWSGMDLAALRNCCITSLGSAGWLHWRAGFVQGCCGNFKAFRSLKWHCSASLPLWRLMSALLSGGRGEDVMLLLREPMETGSRGCGMCPARIPHPLRWWVFRAATQKKTSQG